MILQTGLLVAVPVVPLVLRILLLVTREPEPFEKWSFLAASPGLILAILPGSEGELRLPWLLMGAHWGLDTLGRGFLLFSSLLWLVAGLYAKHYIAKLQRRRFYVFYLLTMAGNLGVLLAQEMLSFYLFFSLMSLASYGLIVHRGNPEAQRAARVYIVFALLGEAALFAGMVLATATAASFELSTSGAAPMALWVLGFGIKAGLMPLHVWLPLAHPVAPTPASAVLSGTIIKVGILGWLRSPPRKPPRSQDGGQC